VPCGSGLQAEHGAAADGQRADAAPCPLLSFAFGNQILNKKEM
jgi:hypothetical protein